MDGAAMRIEEAERIRSRGDWRGRPGWWMRVALLLGVTLIIAPARAAGDAWPDPVSTGEWIAAAWFDASGLEAAESRGTVGRAAVDGVLGLAALIPGVGIGPDVAERVRADVAAGMGSGMVMIPAGDGGEHCIVDRWTEGPAKAPMKGARLAEQAGPGSFAEWPAHRAAARAAGQKGRPCVEIAVNINALRHQLGGAFEPGDGRGTGLLRALRLSNARVVGVHGFLTQAKDVLMRDPSLPAPSGGGGGGGVTRYEGPPLLTLVATWSARSEPPGTVHAMPLTTAHWPVAQVGRPPRTDGSIAVVMALRCSWRLLLEQVLDAYGATQAGGAGAEFALDRANWSRSGGASAARLISGIEPWATIALDGEAWVWRVRLRPESGVTTAAKLLDEALAPAASWTRRVDDGGGASHAAARWDGVALSWRWETNPAPPEGDGRAALVARLKLGPAARR